MQLSDCYVGLGNMRKRYRWGTDELVEPFGFIIYCASLNAVCPVTEYLFGTKTDCRNHSPRREAGERSKRRKRNRKRIRVRIQMTNLCLGRKG